MILPDDWVEREKCASAVAEYTLFGKVDKQGVRLFAHVARVARAVEQIASSHDQIIAAWLHDSVEDSTLTLRTIENLFGYDVSEMVACLTRHNQSYSDYIDLISRVPEVVPIKLADLADNLDESRGPIDESLRRRYQAAQIKLLAVQEVAK